MNHRPIGVFDSGVGGLTVFKALEQALPGESLIYLGDTARVPYGTRSADTVKRYAREAVAFLRRREIKMLVVACNTASAVAMETIAADGLPVLGVIEPGARRAVELSETGRIGVIGTRATIGSGAYAEAIRALEPAADVTSRACPLFVPLAEEGWTDNTVASEVARTYLEPFGRAGVDALVLGCTHYPLLRGAIGQVMGPSVRLVDSAESVAAEVRARLESEPALAANGDDPSGVDHHFFVTDVPEPFQAVAERFLGRPIQRLERTRIEGE